MFVKVKKKFRQKYNIFFLNYNLTPLDCTMDYPKFIVSNQKGESISIQSQHKTVVTLFGAGL